MKVGTDPVIGIEGLTRRFGEVIAVEHLTMEVHRGEVFGFLGHNGAGKTTTVRLLNGVLAPSDGTARVLGLDPMTDGPALRRRTGILTETPSLDERLTGRDNLSIFADLYGVPRDEVPRRVEALLEAFELAHRAGDKAGSYSKGMKQRLALARALLHRPELMFLDEPTAGLDPVAARWVHTMMIRLSHEEERTVVLCTHNLAEAQKLCDRVAVLENGRLVALGTTAELADQLGQSLRLVVEAAPDAMATARDIALTCPGITAVTQDGATITIEGAERETIPNLIAALVAEGVRIYQVTPQEPSLADVYFALHGEKGDVP